MDLYCHPHARFRQQCIDQAIKAGATSPTAAVRGALAIEAHIVRGRTTPEGMTAFSAAAGALTGRCWTPDEAATLKGLVDAGVRP